MAAVIDLSVKKRRISEKDWKQVEDHVKQELSRRETDAFRKLHEMVWKEVDRQVYMKPPQVQGRDKNDWHSSIELGELAKASETITADVMRLIFPVTRTWFEPHVELPPSLDPVSGQNVAPTQKEQIFTDGVLRALMAQQHLDFGLKARLALSIKEALHHGSFVAEAMQETALLVHNGGGIQNMSAPVWVPHSMWNCYPDPSPSVLGTNMLYTGSMIIKQYMPRHKLKALAMKGVDSGWMSANLSKIPKRKNQNKDVETDDLELVKYCGDIAINRNDGDIFLPNSKVILANGVIVYYAPNYYAFPPILYNGYEKLDVRDPYFTSPLIKLSPMHKLASVLANKYVDAVSLRVEPPIIYDGNDPAFVTNGGPVIAPGWRGSTKGSAKYEAIEVGDPNFALEGLQLALDQIRKGHGSDATPVYGSSEKTATQSRIENRIGEVRVVDFVDKLEFSLKTFLYMQHEINKKEMETYSFYNPEMDAPDFMRLTREELPQTAHFDVVGSRGVLGEEERSQKMSVVTAFVAQTWPELIKPADIVKEMYQDAGVKNPERFLNIPGDEMEQITQMVEKKYQQAMQEAEGKIFDLEKKLAISKAVNDARVLEAQIKADTQANVSEYKAQIQGQIDTLKAQLEILKTAAKQSGEVSKQASQVSIKEVADVIGALEKLIDKETSERESKSNETNKKLESLTATTEKLLTQISKPIKLRDAKGNVLKTASRD